MGSASKYPLLVVRKAAIKKAKKYCCLGNLLGHVNKIPTVNQVKNK